MSRKNTIISLIMNVLISVLTIVACVMMFTGFRFMHGDEIILEARKIEMFKFYTIDSNVFMGLIAFIFAIKEIQLLIKKDGDIPKLLYILKLMATASVGLTCFIVFTYLGPITKGGIPAMLMNSNLFLHLIIPVLSIICFVAFEKTSKITFKDSFLGIIPTVLYAIFYLTNAIIHSENGIVPAEYDWYWFVHDGLWTAIYVVPTILLFDYGITYLLWKCNKEKQN